MRLHLRALLLPLFMVVLSFASVNSFGQTIKTDKLDYPPGATVIITGTGFDPKESVQLQVLHELVNGDNDISGAHAPWFVNADESGNVSSTWVVPMDEDELGATLKLIAEGQSSHKQAFYLFTDGNKLLYTISNTGICTATKTSTVTLQMLNQAPDNISDGAKSIKVIFPDGFGIASVEDANNTGLYTLTPLIDLNGNTTGKPNNAFCISKNSNNEIVAGDIIVINVTFSVVPSASTTPYSITGGALNGTSTFSCNGNVAPQGSPTILVSTPPTIANAGPDQSINATTVTLGANTPVSGIGRWIIISGSGGSFGAAPGTSTSSNPVSSFTGVLGSDYILRWTILNGACSPSFDDVNIYLHATIPTSTSVAAATAVYGSTSVNLISTVNPIPSGGTPDGGSVTFYIKDYATIGTNTILGTATKGIDNKYTLTYNPGSLNVGSYTIITSFGGSGNYLSSTSNPSNNGTLSIIPAPLTITATGPTKTYGTALTATTGTTFTTNGNEVAGQSVTSVTLTPDAAGLSATTAAGAGYVVTPSLATGTGGFLASNYDITYVPYNGTVAQKTLTITATGPTKTYGTALTATTGTTFTTNGNEVAGQSVTSVTLTPDAAGLSATTAAGAGYVVTPSLATGTGGFLASNYDITYVPYNGTVAQKTLTITATGPTKTYGTALTATTGTTFTTNGNEVAGQSVTSVTLTPDAAGLSATTAAGAGYVVTPSLATGTGGFLASNYDITYVPYNGTVAQKTLTITATGPTKTYGTALTATTGTTFTTNGNEVAGQSVTSVTLTPDAAGLSATTAAGAGYVVTPSLATGTGGFLASNYDITYVPYNGTVAQKTLTITATGPTKTYGTALTATTGTTFTTNGNEVAGQSVTSVTLTPDAAGLSATTAAGAGYVVTPSLATGTGGFLASNYDITYVPYNGTVAQKTLTITATGPTKTYGTALTATTGTTFTTNGNEVAGQSVTSVTLTPDAAGLSATTAAGAGYVVTPSLATGTGGFLASNYDITYVPYNGTVAQKTLTITATGPTKTYGTALTATTGTTFTTNGNEVAGQSVTSVTLTPDAAGLSATTAAGAGYVVTPSLATGTGGFLASNYDITYVPYNGTVAQKTLTITATGPTKTYGTALTATTGTTFTTNGNEVAGQSVTSVTLTPDAAGLSATTAAGAGYVVTPSLATGTGGFLASNYDITYVPYNGTVAQKTLTITATGPTKTYGTALTATTGTTFTTNGNEVAGQSVTSVTLTPDAAGLSATTAAGAGYVVTPSLATGTGGFLASNYDITYVPYNGTVAQKTLTITATGPTKTYGTALTATTGTTFTTNGNEVAGQSVTSVTLTPDAAGLSATTAAGAGYVVTPSLATGTGGFLASNYDITYVPYNGTVAQKTLTITATGPTKTYGTALTATTGTTFTTNGNEVAGQSVTSVTLTPDAAGLSATTAAGAGYVVTPSLATGTGGFLASNYDITYVPYNGTVAQKTLTITATGPTKTYGTALTATTGTTFTTNGNEVAGQSVTSVTLTPDAAGLSATTAAGAGYVVTPSLATGTGGFLASNYDITYVPYNGTVAQKTLTITATGPTKTYGTALTATTGTTFTTNGNEVAGQSVTSVTLTPDAAGLSATTAAGAGYVVTPSLATGTGGFLASNYDITYVPYNGTVAQKTLTITATGPTKTYGTALTATTGTTFTTNGNEVAGQSVTSVTLTPDAAGLSATTAAGAGYVVTPSLATGTGGFLASNYDITYVPYNGTVAQKTLTITATGPTKTYGTALTATTGTTFTTNGNEVAGQSVTSVTLTPDAAGLSATTAAGAGYVVTPSLATGTGGFLASNYDITYVPYNGTVAQKTLTITATGPTKTYGTALTATTGTTFTTNGNEVAGQSVTSVTLTPDAAGLSATTAAGAGYVVTPSLATGTGGFLASNYDITYVPYNGTVAQKTLTITATGPTKTYGTALTATTGTTFTTNGNEVAGQSVTSVTLTPDAAGLSATTAAGAGYVVTPSLATGTGGFLASNYDITYVPYNGTVAQKTLTITATGPTKTYGTALTATTGTTFTTNGNEVAGQSVTSVTLTPDAAGLSATTAAGAGYVVTPSLATGTGGFLASNYDITYVPYNGTVAAASACVTYNGEMFKNTGSTTGGSANVKLSVVISKDPLNAPGDISTATVAFYKSQNGGIPTLIGGTIMVDNNNTNSNQITLYLITNLSLSGSSLSDSWDINWVIGGNYKLNKDCSDDETVVTVSALSPDFSTGGGYITNKDSRGKAGINGSPEKKNNFGYDVKWNKSYTNLQGHFNTIIRSNNRSYQVKSSKPGSITVFKTTTGYRAYITYQNANFQDLTSLATGTCVPNMASALYPGCSDGGGSVTMVVEDNGEPGSTGTATNDKIAITIKDKNGNLFYASNVAGPIAQIPTVLKNLLGGNIQIRSTSTTKDPNEASYPSSTTLKTITSRQTAEPTVEAVNFNLRAYPNPSSAQFTVQLQSNDRLQKIQVRVLDMSGRTIQQFNNLSANQSLQIGANYRPGMYIVEMIQGNERKQLKLVKQPN